MGALVGDIDYQARLRADFRRRRVHPTVETLVWSHVIGKPAERVQLSADVTMSKRLDKERELFGRLSVEQLAELATRSQELVDTAAAMARANSVGPVPATVRRAQAAITHSCGPKDTGDDVTASNEPPSLAAVVKDVATGESAEPPRGATEG